MRIAVAANSAWYIFNFRRSLLHALQSAGHEVFAISSADAYAQRLNSEGYDHCAVDVSPSGTNPFSEIRTILRLRHILREQRIDAVFSYTPKLNIYIGFAARGSAMLFVPNVSGLGRVFVRQSWLTHLVKWLYRIAFRRAAMVVFQNNDDRQAFVRLGLVGASKTLRVPGSGVDLQHFVPRAATPVQRGTERILFIGRVLADKGIHEFIASARALKAESPGLRFAVLGQADAANPSAVAMSTVRKWVEEALIDYLGATDDVRPFIAEADCVVLPSYREGVPRSILEAAAMGKPCITTNAPGCRDAVDHLRTGWICEARSAEALTTAIRCFVDAPLELRESMGRHARAKMEQEFDERFVIDTYLRLAQPNDNL